MFEKTYDSHKIELKIAQKWKERNAFHAGVNASPQAEPFTIVIPPPNVTGSLHMGHALNNTLQDILVRFERMRGKNVLWQPGTDHAGIATQMVVERNLAKEGISRKDLGRDNFLKRVWAWKAESGGVILNQLKRLGVSCDWSRERFTMDEGLSKAVIEVFVSLYKQGLIYRDKRLVNWDPALLTAISDLEVEQKEVDGKLFFFRYPLEGFDFDPEKPETFLTVATTRPETLLGDTGIAVHADDERYKPYIGKQAIVPLVGRKIPIVSDSIADPEKGTGVVKITPAHDFKDRETGKRCNLAVINIFTQEARIKIAENDDFWANVKKTEKLSILVNQLEGLKRFEARDRLVTYMQEKKFLVKVEENRHCVPHGDRSGVPIEPMLVDQWYVDAHTLAQPALSCVREGRVRFVPENWEKVYFEWMENIQPWCISRQLWWGHQIPAWYGPDGHIFVERTQEEAYQAALAYYRLKEGDAWVAEHTKSTSLKPLIQREDDVLDTWFSSALWPFSTLGWPEQTSDMALRYPTNILVTGFDIIFFWVARMIMLGIHFTGKEPFHSVYVHALVRDQKGAKMSKSKGNVIDPLDVIKDYGADALRFTLASLASPGADIRLNPTKIEGSRNFGTKLWNATRFASINGVRKDESFSLEKVESVLNRWILTELASTIAEVTSALCAFRFNEGASSLFSFVRNLFCDWYLEFLKPIFLDDSEESLKKESRACAAFVLDEILKLLHPFMPFITEELWELTQIDNVARETLLCHAAWSSFSFEDKHAAEEIDWLIDLISTIRSVRSEVRVPAGALLPLFVSEENQETRDRLQAHGSSIRKMARIQSIEMCASAPSHALSIVIGEANFFLSVDGVLDLKAEKNRLMNEYEKIKKEKANIETKMLNESFLRNAPQAVILSEQEKISDLSKRQESVEISLMRIGKE